MGARFARTGRRVIAALLVGALTSTATCALEECSAAELVELYQLERRARIEWQSVAERRAVRLAAERIEHRPEHVCTTTPCPSVESSADSHAWLLGAVALMLGVAVGALAAGALAAAL
jgi:hypothetical protein